MQHLVPGRVNAEVSRLFERVREEGEGRGKV